MRLCSRPRFFPALWRNIAGFLRIELLRAAAGDEVEFATVM
jgi:hypothetical protein